MIKQMLLTPNPYSRPGIKLQQVKAIAVHYVGNPGSSALANRNYFKNLKNTHATKASSHYIIGLQSEILQLIPEDEWSYCTNDRNKETISVECCHPDAGGKFNAVTYASLVDLCVDICKRHTLDPLAGGLIRHYDVTGKVCPKYFVDYPTEWEKFKKEVKEKMEPKKVHWAEKHLDSLVRKGIIDSSEVHRDNLDALITGCCMIVAQILINHRQNNVVLYRIDQLEEKQDKHNGLMERRVIVEQSTKSAHHRLDEIRKEK